MYDEYMPNLTLSLSEEEYCQLPRNSAYQYDYLHGQAFFTPRPKHFHGMLDFSKWQAPDPEEIGKDVHIRSMLLGDRTKLPEIFAGSFERVQPFGGLPREQRLEAARLTLSKTWQGYDGPWLRSASFTAVQSEKKALLGGIMITLVPGGDPSDPDAYRWPDPPVEHWHKDVPGQPHLTWIFVAPLWKGSGIGSALLDKAVTALRKLGYASLWTTFLLGNDASMLWHWRNGFTLAAFPYSRRDLRKRQENREKGRQGK